MTLRTYEELNRLEGFEQRFKYLALRANVGDSTFGIERWINQRFYGSREWKQIRSHVIARDLACDLGVEGYDIHERLLIHHMNPMRARDIVHGSMDILNPDFLITTTHRTHNAIHYGDPNLLPRDFTERKPGDTKLWLQKGPS